MMYSRRPAGPSRALSLRGRSGCFPLRGHNATGWGEYPEFPWEGEWANEREEEMVNDQPLTIINLLYINESYPVDGALRSFLRRTTRYRMRPLHILHQALEEHVKLKVWTLNTDGLRGLLVGFLHYFDEAWNLIMTDVDEVFLKSKKINADKDEVEPDALRPIPEQQPQPLEEKKKMPEEKSDDKENKGELAEANHTEFQSDPNLDKGEDGGNATKKSAEKKKKKRMRDQKKMNRRHLGKMFVNGDCVIKVAILTEEW